MHMYISPIQASISFFANYQHVTDAEVDDAVDKVMNILARHGEEAIAAINVDNGARAVAASAIERLTTERGLPPIVLNRDFVHTVDLVAKDFDRLLFIVQLKKVLDKIFAFVSIDRIDSIRLLMTSEGAIPFAAKAKKNAETRMHGLVDYFESMLAQKEFLLAVTSHPACQKYYGERSSDRKSSLDELFDDCVTTKVFKMVAVSIKLLRPIKLAVKFFSDANAPISAAVLMVQALQNELNAVTSLQYFDRVMGGGAKSEIDELMSSRFNLDLEDTAGRKVALLDRHHGMAALVDPFLGDLGAPSLMTVDRATLAKEMISCFVAEPGAEGDDLRRALWMEFQVCSLVLSLFFVSHGVVALLHVLFYGVARHSLHFSCTSRHAHR